MVLVKMKVVAIVCLVVASTLAMCTLGIAADKPATRPAISGSNIGDEGRPVIGRVEIPAYLPSHWEFDVMRISYKSELEPPCFPDGLENWPAPKRHAWIEEWENSDAGKAYVKLAEQESRRMRGFSCAMKADGTFRIEGIPAGTYTMQVSIFQPPKNPHGQSCERLGVATGEFTMQEISGGRSSEVLDVGVLKVKRIAAATQPTP